MCIKCKKLKQIWWSKQSLIYNFIRGKDPEVQINPKGAIVYERDSSWKALKMQTRKHMNRRSK